MREQLSPQATAVRDILAKERCHLSADEIIAGLPGSSTATVYRCLDQLTVRGRVHKLSLGGRSAVYELVREPHMHFVCHRCGQITDILLDLTGLVGEAARCNGNMVEWSETTAYGLCSRCRAEGHEKEEENHHG